MFVYPLTPTKQTLSCKDIKSCMCDKKCVKTIRALQSEYGFRKGH